MKKSFFTLALALTIALLPAFSHAQGTVSATLQELQTVAASAKAAILAELEAEISQAIAATGVSAERLNATIQAPYLTLKAKLDTVFDIPNADISEKIEALKNDLKTSLASISEQLSGISGKTITISAAATDKLLEQYQADVALLLAKLADNDGLLVFQDSNQNGLSDYDEKYIYPNLNTPTPAPNSDTPQSPTTNTEIIEKLLSGINPITNQPIPYQDIQTDQTAEIIHNFTVDSVELIKNEQTNQTAIKFIGQATPNSLITLYIYSTAFITPLQVNPAGKWNYTLTKNLEDGEHEVFVAIVDNNGKIIAKSNAYPFIKSGTEITLQAPRPASLHSATLTHFLNEYLWAIVLGLFVIIFGGGWMVSGKKKMATADEQHEPQPTSN